LATRPLEEAEFRNSFVDELPGEVAPDARSRQVPGCCYSQIAPTPTHDPRLLAWSDDLAATLGLQRPVERGEATEVLGGSRVLPAMKPFAARYGGHQFGSWAGQLGDGRAISLGEVQALDGAWHEIQLKGAGRTPYSRRADGRAVLRSSLREFACSEAMHFLGVPTTRALSLVSTGDEVVRDMFYSGDARPEPGAVVARVAPTFVRFGSFEILAAHSEIDNERTLADYVLRHHYPHLGEPSEEAYARWFEEICERTAKMISWWMSVGFVHGVMNTDNMSILGVTIDYGPYGWLEPYEPHWTPNTTDFGQHRYAFGRQPYIAGWNLSMLGRALVPLVPDIDALNHGLDTYRSTLEQTMREMTSRKLGLSVLDDPQVLEADDALLNDLPEAMEAAQVDMTLFFRNLSQAAPELASAPNQTLARELIASASYLEDSSEHEALVSWMSRYAERLKLEPRDATQIRDGMLRANPKYVLRNYLAQQAIEAAQNDDLSVLERLMQVLRTPYDEQPEHDDLSAKRPEWARDRPGCATLSCSS
jgi:uncharacterized protein YdiU (UPF0061 family)